MFSLTRHIVRTKIHVVHSDQCYVIISYIIHRSIFLCHSDEYATLLRGTRLLTLKCVNRRSSGPSVKTRPRPELKVRHVVIAATSQSVSGVSTRHVQMTGSTRAILSLCSGGEEKIYRNINKNMENLLLRFHRIFSSSGKNSRKNPCSQPEKCSSDVLRKCSAQIASGQNTHAAVQYTRAGDTLWSVMCLLKNTLLEYLCAICHDCATQPLL